MNTSKIKGSYILIAVVVLLAIWGWSGYNSLVKSTVAMDTQWSQVETVYQRRLDLIPNLVESVKGIMGQEKDVFTAIADARTHYAGATTPNDKAVAAGQVESALGRLLVITENYPQLASSQNVTNLMAQLEGTENRISVERMRYNETVSTYNTAIMTFPKNLLAKMFGFSARAFFKADEKAANAPAVNFTN